MPLTHQVEQIELSTFALPQGASFLMSCKGSTYVALTFPFNRVGNTFRPLNPNLTGIAHMAPRERDSSRWSVNVRRWQGSVKIFSSQMLHLNLARDNGTAQIPNFSASFSTLGQTLRVSAVKGVPVGWSSLHQRANELGDAAPEVPPLREGGRRWRPAGWSNGGR